MDTIATRARRARALVALVALTLGACEDGARTPGADGGELQLDGAITPSEAGGALQDGESAAPSDAATAARDGSAAADGSTPTRDAASDAARDASNSESDAGPPDPSCAPPAAFDVGARYERELFVASDGDDAASGGPAAPLRTIRAAADRAQPGTRVVVRAGTYGAVALGRVQGEAARPIAFVAEGAVIIEGGSGTGWAMSDAAYVVIQGFTIQNAAVHGMNLDDGGSFDTPAHHLVLRDLTVRNAGSGGNNDCIKMSGVDDFWVLDSDVSECDRGELIDMVGCHRGVISGNRFHDTTINGVQAKGGSADTLIHGNWFENIPGRAVNAGGSTGLEFFRPLDAPHEAARLRIIGNVFVRNGSMSGAAVAYVGCDGCVFAHNTVIEPRRWVARILQESTDARFVPARDGLFVNNLIVLATSDLSTFVNVGAGTSPASFTFGNNLWFATDQGAGWSGPTLGGGIPAETGSLVQRDPLLVDRAAGDYRLRSGSPAAGAARPLDLALPSDFDGRCYASPASIGAFAAP